MHNMEELKYMLCDELDEYTKEGRVKSMQDLDAINKLTHSIKSIDTILAMEDAGYSGTNYSYGRGRGSNARRDSMGRYSSGRYSRGTENREALREELMERLRELDNMDSNR